MKKVVHFKRRSTTKVVVREARKQLVKAIAEVEVTQDGLHRGEELARKARAAKDAPFLAQYRLTSAS